MTAAMLRAHGIAVAVRDGWEARLYRRTGTPPEHAEAVVHLATFALPSERGDFGAGAVELMGPGDVFVALFEYGEGSAEQALFRSAGWPKIVPEMFAPERLQRSIRGQSGTQVFFHVGTRAFCLYVVLGSHGRRASLAAMAADAVLGLQLEVSA